MSSGNGYDGCFIEFLGIMGHSVTGLIAKVDSLNVFARKHSLHGPIPLSQGFELLPLRDEELELLLNQPLMQQYDGFINLSQEFVEELKDASSGTTIMYFETDYFAGEGTQGAAVFINGTIEFGPKSAVIGPINEALSILGLTVVPTNTDAFEAIDLGRYRHTEDWVEALG